MGSKTRAFCLLPSPVQLNPIHYTAFVFFLFIVNQELSRKDEQSSWKPSFSSGKYNSSWGHTGHCLVRCTTWQCFNIIISSGNSEKDSPGYLVLERLLCSLGQVPILFLSPSKHLPSEELAKAPFTSSSSCHVALKSNLTLHISMVTHFRE